MISRALFPFLYQDKQQQKGAERSKRKEGDVTIDYVEKKKKNNGDNDEGDYIEFEEVD